MSRASSASIYAYNNITVEGDLNVEGLQNGIKSYNGGISIKGDVVAKAGNFAAIYTYYTYNNGNITVEGSLKAEGGQFGVFSFVGDVTLKGGPFNTKGTEAFGIYAEKNLTVEGSLKAEGGQFGVYSGEGDVTLKGGPFNTKGTEAFGIYAEKNLTVEGSLKTEGGQFGVYSSEGDVTLKGGPFNTKGTEAFGIYAGKNLTVEGDLTVQGKDFGIYADNGDVIIKENTEITSAAIFGVYVYTGKIILEEGSLTSSAGEYALFAVGGIEYPSNYAVTVPEDGAVSPSSYTFNPGEESEFRIDGFTVQNASSEVAATAVIKKIKFNVSFDSNGGDGEMETVTDISGGYTLPDCTLTPPDGKVFECWDVDGVEMAVGDIITVSDDTVITAVWADAPHVHSGTLVSGKAPTCTEDGEKDYYTCSCGKNFENADCTAEIADVNVWKVIQSLGHIDTNSDDKCDTCGADLGNTTTEPGNNGNNGNNNNTTEPGNNGNNNGNTTEPGNNNNSGENTDPDDNKTPQTGDNANIIFWALLLVLSVGIALKTVYRKKGIDSLN